MKRRLGASFFLWLLVGCENDGGSHRVSAVEPAVAEQTIDLDPTDLLRGAEVLEFYGVQATTAVAGNGKYMVVLDRRDCSEIEVRSPSGRGFALSVWRDGSPLTADRMSCAEPGCELSIAVPGDTHILIVKVSEQRPQEEPSVFELSIRSPHACRCFTTLPPWVSNLPEESQRVFRYCVGRPYRISEITEDGHCALDVSEEVDAQFGGFQNELYVEPEFLQPATSSDAK